MMMMVIMVTLMIIMMLLLMSHDDNMGAYMVALTRGIALGRLAFLSHRSLIHPSV